jgi:serine kinase of HPr protein (carbohydrate metabolism regulator)
MFSRTKTGPDAGDIQTVHATCIAIGAHGVLLLGQSGTGKSDLALRLIDRGAVLVSDDQTALTTRGGRLLASPPATLAGKIEVRGVGIVERPWRGMVPIAIAVRLTERYERMPNPAMREPFAGVDVPIVLLNAFETSAPIKVEIAVEQALAAARP